MTLLPDPQRFQLTACRALVVGNLLYTPVWFAYGALCLYARVEASRTGRHDTMVMLDTLGLTFDQFWIVGLVLMPPFHLLGWPIVFGLPMTKRFTRREKWRWFGAILAGGLVALPCPVMAAYWWTLAGRMGRGDAPL